MDTSFSNTHKEWKERFFGEKGLLILNIADDEFIAKKTSQSAPLSNSEGTQTSKAFDKTVMHNLT